MVSWMSGGVDGIVARLTLDDDGVLLLLNGLALPLDVASLGGLLVVILGAHDDVDDLSVCVPDETTVPLGDVVRVGRGGLVIGVERVVGVQGGRGRVDVLLDTSVQVGGERGEQTERLVAGRGEEEGQGRGGWSAQCSILMWPAGLLLDRRRNRQL